jgi:predicted dehydrogenase
MARFSRRRFLEDSLLAAAAAAAVPMTRALAGEKQSRSPNEKLGVAVVGCGGQGSAHLKAYASRKDTQVLYVVDPDETIGNQKVEQVAKLQDRKPQWVADIRQAFDDKAVDLVSTATPNHWHSLVGYWAIKAGKDVYVEKPISHNVNEGRRLFEAARKYKRICQTGTQCRSMAGTLEAIAYVHSGKIGKVNLARGLCYKRRASIGPRGTYEVPKSVNYDLWSGPAPILPLTRPKFHYDWHWQWAYGCGDLGNQGIHQMDIARWGLDVNEMSSQVLGYGGRLGYEDAGDTPNTEVIIHNFGDLKTLVFEVRGLETDALKDAKVGVIFYGTEGYVVLTSYTDGAAFDPSGKLIKKFSGGGDHFGNFIQATRSRKHQDLHADVLEGHLSSALCHTGNISYRLGEQVSGAELKKRLGNVKCQDDVLEALNRTTAHLAANKVKLDDVKFTVGPLLKFDPKSETFPGNDAANKLLTREYRKPYVIPVAGEV